MPTPARLALFLQIADAVAAAHSVGVLHKDLKPANVLVSGDAEAPRVRLSDFGSGHLLEPDRLTQLGITRHGMTVEDQNPGDSTSGTALYIAPELFGGQVPTVKSDVFALGLILYQLLADRLGQPMASGWEADIEDPLLRADLQHATDGNPDRRTAGAGALAEGLRQLDARRKAHAEQQRELDAARRNREALARAQARRPFAWALTATLAAGVSVVGWLLHTAIAARNAAQRELTRATALKGFLDEDLIGRSNPLLSAGGADTTLRQALLDARDQVAVRFAHDADTEMAVRENLALLFNTLDLFKEAEQEACRALDLRRQAGEQGTDAAFRTRALLARVLSRQGRFDAAQQEIDALQRDTGATADPAQRQALAAARSTLDIGKGDFKAADADLHQAVAALRALGRGGSIASDSLRLDLIAVLATLGKHDEAKAQGNALIDEVRRRPGNSDLTIALAQLAMARAYRDEPGEAERLLVAARPVIVARLGENHSRHLQLLGELLGVAFRRNDWVRAAEYAQLAHERVRAKFGDEHVLTYVTLTNWARTLSEAGRPAEALPKAREAYTRLRDIAGATSPQTQDAAFVYALTELDLGHAAAADALIGGLDAQVLESGRATGQWDSAIDALRGTALALRGERAPALALLDASLDALKPEDAAAPPERLYVVAAAAREKIRASHH
jgi:non-specific serine/threonine protein kinase